MRLSGIWLPQWSTTVLQSTSLMDMMCRSVTACNILSYTPHKVDLHTQSHTGNLNHLCRILQLDTCKALASDRGILHWKDPMLVKMTTYLQWKVCNALYMFHFAIPTSDQILRKHNHYCIPVLLVHICNIYRTYLFYKILASIDKHGTQRRSPFLYLQRSEMFLYHLIYKQ